MQQGTHSLTQVQRRRYAQAFDFVVANPPFSDKALEQWLDPANDPFNRFESFGVPPGKQGDYAYLLHIVRTLKEHRQRLVSCRMEFSFEVTQRPRFAET